MRQTARMITLLIATRNRHKVEEIRAILGPGVRCLDLTEVPAAPPLVEDAATFAGNAAAKAEQLARWLVLGASARAESGGRPDFVLADDSGLEVDALDGAPGVHSARFAAMDPAGSANSPDSENNAKLLRLLTGVPVERRTARFRCVLALTPVGSQGGLAAGGADRLAVEIFDGTCEGRIDFAPRGQGGFGYDPLFVPEGYGQSFAELGSEAKNGLSHRARALAKLARRLRTGKGFQPAL